MLAYDAMQALLMGCKTVLKQKSSWGLSNLQPALMQIDGSTPDRTLQGITGQIRFTSEGDVADKTVVVLCVTKGKTSGFTKLVGSYNTFQANGQRLSRIYPSQPDQLIKQCST